MSRKKLITGLIITFILLVTGIWVYQKQIAQKKANRSNIPSLFPPEKTNQAVSPTETTNNSERVLKVSGKVKSVQGDILILKVENSFLSFNVNNSTRVVLADEKTVAGLKDLENNPDVEITFSQETNAIKKIVIKG